MLKRLLGLEEGWSAAAVTLLSIGFGATLIFFASAHLRDAAQLQPAERGCAEWLADPSGPRWVTLTGCRLELGGAVFRRFSGLRFAADAGTSQHFLELFVPLSAGGKVDDPPRAVLATQDRELLAFIDGINQVPVDEVEGYLQAHATHSATLIEPVKLTGYVERITSSGARAALTELTAPDAVVLQQGARPERANALFTLVVGLLFVGFGVRTLARRYVMQRALDALPPE